MLAGGFLLLGLQFGMNPFLEQSTTIVQTVSYVVMSVLAICIALGMVVQVLEQGKEQNEMLLHEFRRGMMTRQLLEQEVTLSETKYRALYDSASDAIFLVDLETMEVLEANTSATQLLGGRSARGQEHFLNLCPNLRGSDGTILQNKRMFDEVFGPSKEFLMTRLNGSTVACEGSANLVQYNKRPVLQLNVREITERKRLEQQLRQSEKLSALGQLVAGVAHELNNPLAVIMGYAQLLAKQKDHDPKLKTDVLKILRESERAAKIVRNLLTFARPREPQMTSVDINRLIAGVIETHEAELNACSIHINARLVPDLPATVADPHQLEQVFTNLFMNAVQALQEQPVPRTIEVVTQLDGQTIRIAVSDNGPGISPEIVSKIFDPFFTTKPPGKGTGLGLSISHSIIQEHRGRIWVQSERGKGAKFHVELPLIRRTAETSCEPVGSDETKLAPPSQSNASRLLVVDDEPGIVEVLCCALSDSGFNVDTANNGNQALERIADNRYDVIISDLCMPGTDGEMLYKRVRESDPDLARRIIFVTGDTVSVKSRTFLEWTGNRWFSKPFNIAELEKAVVNFLDSEPISSK